MSSDSRMFELWVFTSVTVWGEKKILHLQNEILMYSANLFPMEDHILNVDIVY